MQPLAITAVALGVVMLAGVTVTLIRVRRGSAGRGSVGRGSAGRGSAGFNLWHRHGTIPLAAAGLAVGVVARMDSSQTSLTHDIMFAVTTVLLLGALMCALAGAAAATGRRPDSNRA